MEKIPEQKIFQEELKNRLSDSPEAIQTADQIFSLVDGGYQSIEDTNKISLEKIGKIISIIRDVVSILVNIGGLAGIGGLLLEQRTDTSFLFKEKAKEIEKIINDNV